MNKVFISLIALMVVAIFIWERSMYASEPAGCAAAVVAPSYFNPAKYETCKDASEDGVPNQVAKITMLLDCFRFPGRGARYSPEVIEVYRAITPKGSINYSAIAPVQLEAIKAIAATAYERTKTE